MTKDLVITSQGKPVANISLLHPEHRLLETLLTDLQLLHPALQALVGRQLKHGQHLLPAAQMTRSDQNSVRDEVLRLDDLAFFLGQTDADPAAMHIHHRQVLGQVEALGGVRAVDDEIEREPVRLFPALLRRGDVSVRTKLARIGLLGPTAGDGPDLRAQRLGEHHAKVADASQADDTDLLTGPGPVADQRRVCGQTGAEHGGDEVGLEGVGDGKHPVLVGANVGGVAALADDARLGPLGAVCVDHEDRAVGLVVVLALLAFTAGVGLSADADTLAFLDQGHFGANANCTADDLCWKQL